MSPSELPEPPEPSATALVRHPVHAASGHRLGASNPRRRGPADLRLVPPAAATWAATAWALGAPPRLAATVVAACCAAAAAVLCRSRRGIAPALAAALLCAAAGAAVAALHTAAARSGPLPGLAGTGGGAAVEAEVTVGGDPRQAAADPGRPDAPRAVLLSAEAARVRTGTGSWQAVRTPVLVVAETERPAAWLRLLPGTRLRLTARVAQPMPGHTPAELAAVLRVTDAGPPGVTASPNLPQRIAGHLRDSLREASSGLPGDAGALLPALVIGDDSGITPELEEAVRATGLTHLVVVSGAQVAIVLGVLIGPVGLASLAERRGLAARLGIPLRTTAVLGGVLLLAFVLVCRPEPSVLRAAVCGGVALLAIATGRHRSLLPALAAATMLLLLWEPVLARSFGFLLSVLATGSLLTLAPRWSGSLRRRGTPRPLAEAIAAAAAAHAVCAPVVTVFAPGTSLVAIPCNLLAAPAVAPAVVLGWLALVTAPVCLPAGAALAWLASWPTRWIAGVARTGAALPGAELGWPGGWSGAASLAAVTLAVLVLVRRSLRSPWLGIVGVLLLLLAVLRPAPLPRILTGWPPAGWRVVACDVGQGDALVLAAADGAALVVDTGPDPAAVDRCLRELEVRRIPLLVLSHFHADHVAGLPGALRGREVGAIQTSTVRDSPEQAAFVDRVAAEAGVRVIPAVPGERRRIGEGLSWQVLWPPADAASLGYEANDASVTLLLRTGGLGVLLPGDLEPAAQRRLLAEHPELPPVDVLKVAHHGSAGQHPPLLARLSPRLALISAGADNDYGHPAPGTLAALRAAGAVVLRTDRHGALAVTETDEGPRGVARRGLGRSRPLRTARRRPSSGSGRRVRSPPARRGPCAAGSAGSTSPGGPACPSCSWRRTRRPRRAVRPRPAPRPPPR
ncbi:ComEC/Rec2 family competence protein [Streptomyces sp. 6N223]|uniref:ComEC/Rec2 family competence protein n=1 Tax=Streptomyces sp. 6N223 TaxID=3457412 RepID=UPI003FD5FC8D